jgi:hypothetical protein
MRILDLRKGDHFKLRNNGRWYTIHEFARSVRFAGSTTYSGDLYALAVNRGIMYAFDVDRKIII